MNAINILVLVSVLAFFATIESCYSPLYGRSFDIEPSIDIQFIEKKAFELCDEDGDTGLSWEEVEICEVTYGPYVKITMPTEDEFDSFDLDQNGILFFEEWLSHH